MRAHFGLPSVKSGKLYGSCMSLGLRTSSKDQAVEKRAPITVKFEIPYFTVSGIQVRYLKIVEKSGYQALPWVRYITQNGDDYRYKMFTPFPSLLLLLNNLLVFALLWKRAVLPLCQCDLVVSISCILAIKV